MGHTLIEKIIMKNTGAATVTPGQIVTVNVDRVMIHDIFIPFVAEKFKEMGFKKVWDPDKICLIYDHMVPTSAVEDVRHFQIGDAFAAEQHLTHVHRTDGICHQLMPEMGYAGPGQIVFGTDSHTTTYGAVGCFSSGIGYTEMAAILGTGELWVRVPETIRIEIDGELPRNVSAKDIILTILGDLRADGATYTGPRIRRLHRRGAFGRFPAHNVQHVGRMRGQMCPRRPRTKRPPPFRRFRWRKSPG